MKAFNALYFQRKLDFYFEFIPQIVLLWCIFGYMITLIVVKWLTLYTDTSIAPSIIAYMIEMFLNFGAISGDAIISSQGINETLHIFLLLTALICVPTMLVVKPYFLHKQNGHHKNADFELHELGAGNMSRDRRQRYQRFEEEDDPHIGGLPKEERKSEDDPRDFKGKGFEDLNLPINDPIKDKLMNAVDDLMDHGDHSISEIAIHQLIETIEFVLGSISNTASYLRLWALSLAHSQLAAVFFEKTLEPGLEARSAILLSICFPIFATATFGVLM